MTTPRRLTRDDPSTTMHPTDPGPDPTPATQQAPATDLLDDLWPTRAIPSDASSPPTLTQQLGEPSGTPGGEADLLSTPIDDGDLAATLERHRRNRPATSTMALAAVLVAGIAFTAGILTQKDVTPAAAAATGTGRTAAAAGGTGRTFGAAGTGTGAGAAGAAAAGTVELVDGSTVYVLGTNGSVTKVLTSAGTTIKVTVTGTVKQLAPGTTVVVTGTRAADGTVTASGITQGGSGGFTRTTGGTGTTRSTGGPGAGVATPAPSN